ncbi:26S proteasome non-ATPase regulatory subunit 6 like protein [Verticillium longisporum]|nr:26S proteasome non-ATPase regulatory subunit 6 like protein [Verticillium longisporum]
MNSAPIFRFAQLSLSAGIPRTTVRNGHTWSRRRTAKPELSNFAPGHGEQIWVWHHLTSHQIIYSHTPQLDSNHALKQLPFIAKKSTPAKLRKDLWRPMALIHLVGMIATKSQTTINLPWDEDLYKQLKSENDAELEGIQKEEDEAVEQAGDTEVQAARGKRAEFWARVGEKDRAITAYEDVFEKTGILGTKIDLVLAIVRMGLFYGDKLLTKKHVERAKALVESGGDWDRRNRLKAYEGLHLLTIRSYAAAAPLLLDSLSTFTSYELCTYSSLVVYSVLAGSVSLKRVDFKSKVVDAPEIKAILGDGEDKMLALSGALSAGPGADDSSSAEEASTSVKKGAKTAEAPS